MTAPKKLEGLTMSWSKAKALWNVWKSDVTEDVSKLSGWLKTSAPSNA